MEVAKHTLYMQTAAEAMHLGKSAAAVEETDVPVCGDIVRRHSQGVYAGVYGAGQGPHKVLPLSRCDQ